MKFQALRKNLKKDYSGLKTIKIAVVADWAVQLLEQAIRGYGYEKGLDLQLYEAAYDQMEAELLDPESALYNFEPDYILLFPCAEKFHERYHNSTNKALVADSEFSRIENLCKNSELHSKAKILLCNFCEINDGVYGNYAGYFEEAFLYNQRKVNSNIARLAMSDSHVYMIDINQLQSEYGRKNIVDDRLYYISKTIFKIEFMPIVAERLVSIINVLSGKMKKCLIVDLDNTLWGGVIGDDGLEGIKIGNLGIGEAFSNLQKWIKELSQRGVAVAVCSKNNEEIAKEPFRKHSEMVLSLEDISVFVANWEDKATNIKKIQQVLNIGFDSMVFIDDNPFERGLVKKMIPDIEVPDLPEDPAHYLSYLCSLNLFETANISNEDRKRTQLYREEAKRNELKSVISNVDDYLSGLDMKAVIRPFNSFSLPRVAQLSQRSNQFNLRTKRYTEQDIENMINHPEKYITMTVELKDKFGEYGIICVVVLEKKDANVLFIDTMLMSCRVLKRTVEEFVFNQIILTAKKFGFKTIVGEYLPTAKNGMVKDLLNHYDFVNKHHSDSCDRWELEINNYTEKKTFVEGINEKEWSI